MKCEYNVDTVLPLCYKSDLYQNAVYIRCKRENEIFLTELSD